MKRNNWGCRGLAGAALLGLLFFSGCAANELENRDFPTILTVSSDSNFSSEWLNGLQEGNKKIDYNHLKVILVERGFLEDDEAMGEMLNLLKSDKNVPLNAYVVTTEQLEEIKGAEEKLSISLGNYLEELLEHGNEIKKETYPTIGMLYQEAENRIETLFIPSVSLVEEKPEVTAYEVYKRGSATGLVEPDVALLSFFITNQMDEYVLQLGVNQFVRLSNARNEIAFIEGRAPSGLIKRQVMVEIDCDGKILQQNYGKEADALEDWLETQIKEYMTAKASDMLKKGIDVTNSMKKLGTEREWYQYYMQAPDFYEEDIEILFELDIDWAD